ncbi:nuclease-related domain-containing protein [Sporosarcina sp. Te-1]|uniref:nuclease-related domain-containing protein n=1 Tax=Sporosarcina sp. Te-1 TaxID=2818390 RepID=UPI001A9F9E30|nr:nuclease-related domain-containing protein [Sporosarcina sp. Te-1]QTD40774.1 NERD domain-containing protein [Sporosarcina sp. Te-1]
MIYKSRRAPLEIEGLTTLERRLARDHPVQTDITKRLYNMKAGYSGERQYDRYISEFKPSYPHAILHDVCLKLDDIYFQMDSILITPSKIIISEVKNLAEKIIVKTKPLQFIKETQNGERVPFRSPITELDRKVYLLGLWLRRRRVDIPIEGIVTFAYNNELRFEETPPVDVIFTYEIAAYLRSLTVERELLNRQSIHKLANEIISADRPYDPFPLVQRYSLQPDEILPGVSCPSFNQLTMRWIQRSWKCVRCGQIGKKEHHHAVKEWLFIQKNTITNREFRNFTLLDSRHTAKLLLAGIPQLQMVGKCKGSFYRIK